jgi:primosomal protein N' (replication factor Y)
MKVEVPLGQRVAKGYLIGFSETTSLPALREIHRVLEDSLSIPPALIRLAGWITRYYRTSVARAVGLLIPPAVERARSKQTRWLRLARPEEEIRGAIPTVRTWSKPAASLLEALLVNGGEAPLRRLAKASPAYLARLAKEGLLEESRREIFRDPFPELRLAHEAPPALSPGQQSAMGEILAAFERDRFRPFLLHGVTGSGKTEIYLRAVEEAYRRGKGSIVLVPEIGLTGQLLARFRKRFGDQVVLFHSALSAGERLDAWRMTRTGGARIALGTRSALFAPLTSLGLIVVDEEQDTSYKQEEGVRYHARDVALVRAQQEGAVVILGSATPSLESYQNSVQGKYRYLSLTERIDGRPLPKVEVVPLSKDASGVFLSPPLLEAIQKRLDAKEQTLLFLNRRGFAPFILCLECGEVPGCPHCSVSLTLHKRRGVLLCHYCGLGAPPPARCARCRGGRLKEMGLGTERLEEILRDFFPKARIVRMDRDTTQRKRAHYEILQGVTEGEVDILIGTQMIAKGHDLQRVTLVGILCADLGLQLPDFRSAERTFQLLVQVAGRAGRGTLPGEVLIQAYNLTHYTLRYAPMHDVLGFYREELLHRKEGPYPPFCRLIAVRLRGKDETEVKRRAGSLASELRGRTARLRPTAPPGAGAVEILGPSPCPLERIRGEYRWQILLRGPDSRPMASLIENVLPQSSKGGSVKVEVDVDPQQLL